MVQAAERHQNLLDPAVLARVTGLELRARMIAQGLVSGMHRSPYRGYSVEFAEHRKYCQGDDLRFMDWKVYGRTDKHYVKQYEQETNLQLLLAVDCSESMDYRSAGSAMSKREYAATVAATMAYLALRQSDAVGVCTFDSAVHRHTRVSNNPAQWRAVVHDLEHARGAGRTAFREVFDQLAEGLTGRHMVVILSDLLGDVPDVAAGLRHLRHRRHEPLVMHVLDRAELTFPFKNLTQFRGLEALGALLTDPRGVRERYLEEVRRFIDALRRQCREQRIDYDVFDTGRPLGTALSIFLAARAEHTSRGFQR